MTLFIQGMAALCTPLCLILMFLGVFVGIIFGCLPGLSTITAFVLFLPFTYTLEIYPAFSLLMGIFVGGASGGLISAILLNTPGTAASVATCFDGYPMTKRGEAAKALGVALLASFIGTLIGVGVLIFAAPTIAKVALTFTNYEYFSLTFFSLTLIAGLSGKSMLKGIAGGLIGIAIGTVGLAPIDSVKRFTFGLPILINGFEITTVVIAFFAFGEVLNLAENVKSNRKRPKQNAKIKGFGVSFAEMKGQILNLIRSSLIGVGIGILPGIGGGTSNLIAYAVAKSCSKYPEKFGTGIIDGIVASETDNNASLGGALVPLLTLGIPGDGPSALLLGAFTVHGLAAGPLLFTKSEDLVYFIFACMLVGSFVMLIEEFFGMRIFIRILALPISIIMPIVMLLCIVGTYAVNNRMFDVVTILIFAVMGYLLKKFEFPLTPVMLGYILGSMVETYLRRALQMSKGSLVPFFTRPVSLVFIVIAVAFLVYTLIKNYKESKTKDVEAIA